MNPIVNENQLKSLKLFSYYAQSYGIKTGYIPYYITNCDIDYPSNILYSDDGSYAELYDAISEVFLKLIDENELTSIFDCDNTGELRFEIDCVKRKLSVKVYENTYKTEDYQTDKKIDELDKEIKESIDQLFIQSDEPTFSVSFQGSGDDGYIDGYTNNNIKLNAEIKDFLFDWLQSKYGGWENNEGSQGDFYFDYGSQTITLNFGENYQDNIFHDIDFQISF